MLFFKREITTGLRVRLIMLMLVGSLTLTGFGCGTVVNFTSDTKMPMGGVVVDAHFIKAGISGHEGGAHQLAVESVGYLFILDLPFSLGADFLTLPYTIPYQLTKDSESPTRADTKKKNNG